MSEEIKNATTVVPRSIVYGLIMNGAIGFGTIIAALFCIGDPEAISQTEYTYPFIAIFVQATKSKGGSAVMVSLILLVGLGLDIGIMAAASRMLWSFARDHGVPGWQYVSKVLMLLTNPLPQSQFAKLTIAKGRWQNENPHHRSLHHNHPLHPPRSHKHRLLRRLQRRRLPHPSRPLRLLLHSLRPPPLAAHHPLHPNPPRMQSRRHRNPQCTRKWRKTDLGTLASSRTSWCGD